jgi:hypothetical protein
MLAGEPVQDLVAELCVSDATHYKWRRQELIDAIAVTITAALPESSGDRSPGTTARDERQIWRTLTERQPHPAPVFPQLPDTH